MNTYEVIGESLHRPAVSPVRSRKSGKPLQPIVSKTPEASLQPACPSSDVSLRLTRPSVAQSWSKHPSRSSPSLVACSSARDLAAASASSPPTAQLLVMPRRQEVAYVREKSSGSDSDKSFEAGSGNESDGYDAGSGRSSRERISCPIPTSNDTRALYMGPSLRETLSRPDVRTVGEACEQNLSATRADESRVDEPADADIAFYADDNDDDLCLSEGSDVTISTQESGSESEKRLSGNIHKVSTTTTSCQPIDCEVVSTTLSAAPAIDTADISGVMLTIHAPLTEEKTLKAEHETSNGDLSNAASHAFSVATAPVLEAQHVAVDPETKSLEEIADNPLLQDVFEAAMKQKNESVLNEDNVDKGNYFSMHVESLVARGQSDDEPEDDHIIEAPLKDAAQRWISIITRRDDYKEVLWNDQTTKRLCIELRGAGCARDVVWACSKLRHWANEACRHHGAPGAEIMDGMEDIFAGIEEDDDVIDESSRGHEGRGAVPLAERVLHVTWLADLAVAKYLRPVLQRGLKSLKPHPQRRFWVNQFPRMQHAVHKAPLARELNRIYTLLGEFDSKSAAAFGFYPRTFLLPGDEAKAFSFLHENIKTEMLQKESGEARRKSKHGKLSLPVESRNFKRRTLIVKPSSGSQGKGIELIQHPNLIREYAAEAISQMVNSSSDKSSFVCQEYLERPVLVRGLKVSHEIHYYYNCARSTSSAQNIILVLLFAFGCVNFPTTTTNSSTFASTCLWSPLRTWNSPTRSCAGRALLGSPQRRTRSPPRPT